MWTSIQMFHIPTNKIFSELSAMFYGILYTFLLQSLKANMNIIFTSIKKSQRIRYSIFQKKKFFLHIF